MLKDKRMKRLQKQNKDLKRVLQKYIDSDRSDDLEKLLTELENIKEEYMNGLAQIQKLRKEYTEMIRAVRVLNDELKKAQGRETKRG